uniref:Uncharacterized protein n=1 Tax=Sphaeramia orbicularis TaxID=375764 RepID=A0A673B6Y5_9TELE
MVKTMFCLPKFNFTRKATIMPFLSCMLFFWESLCTFHRSLLHSSSTGITGVGVASAHSGTVKSRSCHHPPCTCTHVKIGAQKQNITVNNK